MHSHVNCSYIPAHSGYFFCVGVGGGKFCVSRSQVSIHEKLASEKYVYL